jgi:hypothetical protein
MNTQLQVRLPRDVHPPRWRQLVRVNLEAEADSASDLALGHQRDYQSRSGAAVGLRMIIGVVKIHEFTSLTLDV